MGSVHAHPVSVGFGPSMYTGSDVLFLFNFYAELATRKYKYCAYMIMKLQLIFLILYSVLTLSSYISKRSAIHILPISEQLH